MADVWEDRKPKREGNGSLSVNIPKTWHEAFQQDFGDVMNARFIFEIKDGKPSVRLE